MSKEKSSSARKMTQSVQQQNVTVEDVSAEDYSGNMFRDGNNRAAHIKNVRAYDEAAHTPLEDEDNVYGNGKEAEELLDSNLDATEENLAETLAALKHDTTRSRDGADASGNLDESGGFLGGTTKEVDDLEATAMPVDKIPHMKD